MEVVLDLRTVGDVEAERAEQRFDALQRARDGMQRSGVHPAPGQRNVERVGRELRRETRVGERLAPARERGLERAPWPR